MRDHMFESFSKDLKIVARRIRNTFELLDSARLNHPNKPARVRVETLFEKHFKKYISKKRKR